MSDALVQVRAILLDSRKKTRAKSRPNTGEDAAQIREDNLAEIVLCEILPLRLMRLTVHRLSQGVEHNGFQATSSPSIAIDIEADFS
jgi:hypothetical protein